MISCGGRLDIVESSHAIRCVHASQVGPYKLDRLVDEWAIVVLVLSGTTNTNTMNQAMIIASAILVGEAQRHAWLPGWLPLHAGIKTPLLPPKLTVICSDCRLATRSVSWCPRAKATRAARAARRRARAVAAVAARPRAAWPYKPFCEVFNTHINHNSLSPN